MKKPGEWNSRLHKQNQPARVEDNRANGIRVYTNKTRLRGLKKPGEWNSRLYKQNPPARVEDNRANGIPVYTNKTRLRGLKKTGRMEFASIQTKPACAG
ncbi:MAG: hypothetical protein EAZ23_08390 [Oscillatoriales cyanobacterium]|nr:MAG: hypothetical protein EAZ23_08390 [Oscillatoriales cyanobacterium]